MAETPHDTRLADEAPIVRISHTIIQQAIQDGASEIQVQPGADVVEVSFRRGGVLHEAIRLPGTIHQDLVDRYKTMAEMNVGERSVPQDGRIAISHQGKDYDLRVHSEPAPNGEKVAIAIHVG